MEFEQLEMGKNCLKAAIARQDVADYYEILHPNVLLVSHFEYPPAPPIVADTIPHIARGQRRAAARAKAAVAAKKTGSVAGRTAQSGSSVGPNTGPTPRTTSTTTVATTTTAAAATAATKAGDASEAGAATKNMTRNGGSGTTAEGRKKAKAKDEAKHREVRGGHCRGPTAGHRAVLPHSALDEQGDVHRRDTFRDGGEEGNPARVRALAASAVAKERGGALRAAWTPVHRPQSTP
ncbi:uncharacterized protein Tco025E_02819 [Trypanosoma conorhini]|uniref:Uncharacterized protein n=1 Tax=Trypanosoma conorhini TaxID=83891 RepID=A0A422Q073_9TRYP|nr:uncharacterized protein Tco025E_02819 [Trypanosoma conorhini]RNF23405.1 hypothetical protein Tco025E_02819 [Trypanosoma conorhini]